MHSTGCAGTTTGWTPRSSPVSTCTSSGPSTSRGAIYETHSHPYEQFSLLLSGRLLLTVGDETREIGPGDGWYAPADMPHGGKVLGDEPAVFLDVYSPATTAILRIFETARPIPAGERSGAGPQG